MNGFLSVFKRELKGYFATPVAYVFLVIFLSFAGLLTFKGGFFEARQATLRIFFSNMPLLFIFLAPALAMRLWAEERKSNSIELLFTLPLTTAQAVLGKFFAAWGVVLIALVLTFPMIITVYKLGSPDCGPIFTGYVGSFLLAGSFLAVGSFFSSITRNQVIAFVLSVVGCGIFLFTASPSVMISLANFFPKKMVYVFEWLSFQSRFESMLRGVLELRDLGFFAILIAGWLWANIVILEERKAD
ncbi:MAG: ABC transporter permease [Planctomycetota bacterium]|jgi:ABC-2 type transport system permease protein